MPELVSLLDGVLEAGVEEVVSVDLTDVLEEVCVGPELEAVAVRL